MLLSAIFSAATLLFVTILSYSLHVFGDSPWRHVSGILNQGCSESDVAAFSASVSIVGYSFFVKLFFLALHSTARKSKIAYWSGIASCMFLWIVIGFPTGRSRAIDLVHYVFDGLTIFSLTFSSIARSATFPVLIVPTFGMIVSGIGLFTTALVGSIDVHGWNAFVWFELFFFAFFFAYLVSWGALDGRSRRVK